MKVKTYLAVSFLAAMFLIFSIGACAEETTPTNGSQNFMSHWDKNNDGKVSKDEFGGPDDHFTSFDKNGDGSIEATEAPTGPPPRSGGSGGPGGTDDNKGFISHWDKNNDGKVSKDEFGGPDDHFTNFDKNGDGSIETSEAPTGPPPRSGGSGGPGGGGSGSGRPGGGGASDEQNR